MDSLSGITLDSPLTGGNNYYYTLFIRNGLAEDDTQWAIATQNRGIVPADYNMTALLFRDIPEFYRILDAYPPGLGRVMRLDPTLMTNATYLASYPNVAAFLSQHPDVPRNPASSPSPKVFITERSRMRKDTRSTRFQRSPFILRATSSEGMSHSTQRN